MEKCSQTSGAVASALDTIYTKRHGSIHLGNEIALAKGRMHEIQGDSADIFALATAGQMTGPIFWIGLRSAIGSVAPTGLERFIDPARCVVIEGVSRLEVLWATEQALRLARGACVITELKSGPDLRESRRLQIASEEGGAMGLILVEGCAQTSAAETRWRCDAISDQAGAWRWACTKNRKGDIGVWHANWRGEGYGPDTFHLASATAA